MHYCFKTKNFENSKKEIKYFEIQFKCFESKEILILSIQNWIKSYVYGPIY